MEVGALEVVCSGQTGECWALLWGVPVVFYVLGVSLVCVLVVLKLLPDKDK